MRPRRPSPAGRAARGRVGRGSGNCGRRRAPWRSDAGSTRASDRRARGARSPIRVRPAAASGRPVSEPETTSVGNKGVAYSSRRAAHAESGATTSIRWRPSEVQAVRGFGGRRAAGRRLSARPTSGSACTSIMSNSRGRGLGRRPLRVGPAATRADPHRLWEDIRRATRLEARRAFRSTDDYGTAARTIPPLRPRSSSRRDWINAAAGRARLRAPCPLASRAERK